MYMLVIGDEDAGDLRHFLRTLGRDGGQNALEFAMPHPRGQKGFAVRALLDFPVTFRLILRERPSRRSGDGGQIHLHLLRQPPIEHAANGQIIIDPLLNLLLAERLGNRLDDQRVELGVLRLLESVVPQ